MRKFFSGFILGIVITLPAIFLTDHFKEPQIVEKVVVKEIEVPKEVEVIKEVVVEKEVIRKTDLEVVAASCKNSCVTIYAYKGKTKNQGSGWIYNGYVVTAKHVVEGFDEIFVFTDDTENSRYATVHYIDPDLDLAVLKAPVTLPSLNLGDSNKLIDGEKLVSITSPEGIKNVIGECIYSGRAHFGTDKYLTLSKGTMSPGSSGGPIFNYNSEVVGMVVEGNKGGNYAIPVNDMKSVLEQLD